MADQELLEKKAENKIVKMLNLHANELSTMMEVPVNEIISSLMSLGFMVTMNQRLDQKHFKLL